MKILLHEYGGYAFITQLSRELCRRGHAVCHAYSASVQTPQGGLTVLPNDPPGLSFFPIKLAQPIDKYSFLKRALQEREHTALLLDLLTRERPEVVISADSPSTIQWALLNVCRRKKIPFINWVQDLFGIAAQRILAKKIPVVGGLVGNYFVGLDRKCARDAGANIAISDAFLEQFRKWGLSCDHTTVIPNWASLEDLPPRDRENAWKASQGLAGKTIFLYSGTLAMKHNPALLLEAARQLRDRDEARVVVISEGKGIEFLAERKRVEGLDKLVLLPFQPFESLPDVLGSAEVLMAILEPDASDFSVPSKVLAYMCAERALLLGVPSENLAARIVERQGAGLVFSPSDLNGFGTGAVQLLCEPATRAAMARRARMYAETHFQIGQITDQFEAIIARALVR